MATPSFASPQVTASIVSQFAYLHKPDVRQKLIKAYPEQYGLEWFTGLGWMHEAATQERFTWQENDKFMSNPNIGAAPTINAGDIVIVFGAGSYALSGAYSPGRVGETVFLPNGLQGYISVKTETGANNHSITLIPLGFQADGVTAITAAQLGANLSIGQEISIYGSAFGEGSFGQTKSMITNVSEYENYLMNLSDDLKITFDEMTNQTWVNFGDGQYIYSKYMTDMEARVERSIMGSLFMGAGGTVAGAGVDAGKTVRITEGFYTTADLRGSKLPYSKIGKGYFDNIERIFRRNYSGVIANDFVGPEWVIAAQDYIVDYNKNRPLDHPSNTINIGFDQAKIAGITHNIMPLGILRDPQFLGVASGKKFTGLNFITPGGTSTSADGSETSLMVMRYKPRKERGTDKGREWYSLKSLGWNSEYPNTTEDIREVHIKVKGGAEFHRAAEAILSHPM